jgi:uncharacterized membrane protein
MDFYDKTNTSIFLVGLILLFVGFGLSFKSDCSYNDKDGICKTSTALFWTGIGILSLTIITRFLKHLKYK